MLVRVMTNSDPGSEPYSTSIDARVLLFTLAISVVVSLLFSVAPVLHFLRPDLANALRQSTGTASKGSQRFRKLAVGVQIALSVILLGGAGLFVRTLDNLRSQPVGFETENLCTFGSIPPAPAMAKIAPRRLSPTLWTPCAAFPALPLPAATTDPELSGDTNGSSFTVQGYKPSEDETMNFEEPWVMTDYFATLRQPLLAGREFTSSDAQGQPKVAVVNLSFAKHYYGSAQARAGPLAG